MQVIIWEKIVAKATPATPFSKMITRIMLRTALIIPAIIKKYRGLLVSPVARRIAAP